MNDKLNTTLEAPETGEAGKRANPSSYLERKSATVLMVIKLAEGLGKLCPVIIIALLLRSFLSVLNRIFQQGSTVNDGKALVAQFLKMLQVPMDTIRQIIELFPSDISFSSRPVLYVFLISLPFVLIAVLEAVAAIRLRFGKGGTRTIRVLHKLYFALDALRLLIYAIAALALSIFTIVRLGGTVGVMLSTVYVSLAVFFILIGLPTVLYHWNIAGIMKDVRYEMETGTRAERKGTYFKELLIVLIVLEVLGAIISVIAAWKPQQEGFAAALLIVTLIGPAVKLLKYICVLLCNRNFLREYSATETEKSVSHVPQIVLIVLVTLAFAIPSGFLCAQSKIVSNAVAEQVETFVRNARQTVNRMSNTAEAQVDKVQSEVKSTIDALNGAVAAVTAPQKGTDQTAAGTAVSPEDVEKMMKMVEGMFSDVVGSEAETQLEEVQSGVQSAIDALNRAMGKTGAPQKETKQTTKGTAASPEDVEKMMKMMEGMFRKDTGAEAEPQKEQARSNNGALTGAEGEAEVPQNGTKEDTAGTAAFPQDAANETAAG